METLIPDRAMKTLYHAAIIAFLAAPLVGFSQEASSPAISEKLPKRIESEVPVRPITRGPAYRWFGYYDKLQFDPSA